MRSERAYLLETTGLSSDDKVENVEKLTDEKESKASDTQEGQEAGKVYIVPTLQMNVINYREDEHTFSEMIKQLVLGNS